MTSQDGDVQKRNFKGFGFKILATMAVAASIMTSAVRSQANNGSDEAPIISAMISNPGTTQSGWTRTHVTVPFVRSPPKIDGIIDDQCWRTAAHISGFYRSNSPTPVVQQTEAWICADRTHLYVAFHCIDTEPGRIAANETQRNGNIFNDDNVSVKIDSQNLHRSDSEFALNPRGTQWQNIEGGTTDNIRWAGDWIGASHVTSDGWSAEFAIPFAILHYPKGAKAFGVFLSRKLARESSDTSWPQLPPGGENQAVNYYAEMSGLDPIYFPPRPTFLPYVLATAGATNAGRVGMDIKYPLTTTITGLAALFPDFATIEQDVANVNFSYTEKYINDRRPFFAEGNGFLPSNDIFYSPRVAYVDEGIKVVGKQGADTIGALATNSDQNEKQRTVVLSARKDIGLYDSLETDFAANSMAGSPTSQNVKLEGDFGWRGGRDSYNGSALFLPSWEDGRQTGSKKYVFLNEHGQHGKVAPFADYLDITPGFTNPIGYNPEVDIRGGSINLEQYNQFDSGWIEQYDVGVSDGEYHHHDGSLYKRFLAPYINVSDHRGLSVTLDWFGSERPGIRDSITHGAFNWGGKTLYQHGSINLSHGRQDNQLYSFFTFSEQALVRRNITAELDYNHLTLGNTLTVQSILTATYLLDPNRVVAARVVKQDRFIDTFVSYGARGRDGTDIFLVFGDANTSQTVNKVTLKIVRAY